MKTYRPVYVTGSKFVNPIEARCGLEIVVTRPRPELPSAVRDLPVWHPARNLAAAIERRRLFA